jgi:hypothetical protein
MTITFATNTITDRDADSPTAAEPITLDGGLLFQPSPVVEQARQLAAEGLPVTVSICLAVLERAPLTGVSRWLLEASIENRLRQTLQAAGYRSVTRRAADDAIVVDASV